MRNLTKNRPHHMTVTWKSKKNKQTCILRLTCFTVTCETNSSYLKKMFYSQYRGFFLRGGGKFVEKSWLTGYDSALSLFQLSPQTADRSEVSVLKHQVKPRGFPDSCSNRRFVSSVILLHLSRLE